MAGRTSKPEKPQLIGGCAGTQHGCCADGTTSAHGPNRAGCPETRLVGGCAGTRHGCCNDGVTSAHGPNRAGCPETRLVGGCAGTRYGCCNDGVTVARGENNLGCQENPYGGCGGTQHGCCSDGRTAATGPNKAGCPEARPTSCEATTYGCCPDKVTPAKGYGEEGCREFDPAVCGLPKASGTCTNYTMKWHFYADYGMCRQFWYGGCDGNANRFDSEMKCKQRCVDVKEKDMCRLPVIKGPCKARKRRFYYNAGSGRCLSFYYGGCRGNKNNFKSLRECESQCRGVTAVVPSCTKVCQNGGNLDRARCECACPSGYSGELCENSPVCTKVCQNGGDLDPIQCKCQCPRKFSGDLCENVQVPTPQVTDCKYSRYGCCSDRVTAAEGPNLEGCDEVDGSGDMPCEDTQYGCCDDGVTAASGPFSKGCEDTPDSDDREIQTTTKPKMEKCTAPDDRRKCTKYSVMWRFDQAKQACERHWWGGCADNGNVFDSQEECEVSCLNNVVITDTTEEPDFVNICDMPMETGPCRAYLKRFYFNPRDKVCSAFTYGGCGGNENNFKTLEDCQQECLGDIVTEITTTQTPPVRTLSPPDDKFSLTISGERFVDEGREIRVTCQITGSNQEKLLRHLQNQMNSITFYINGVAIDPNDSRRQVTSDSVVADGRIAMVSEVVISRARLSDSGSYSCYDNSGESETMTIVVRQNEDPVTVAPTTQAPDYGTESSIEATGNPIFTMGSEGKLVCRAVGPRRPDNIEWFINGRLVDTDSHASSDKSVKTYNDPRALNALISELTVPNAQKSNEGQYICRSRPYGVLKTMDVTVQDKKTDPAITSPKEESFDPQVVCLQKAEAGNCLASFTRWHYDSLTGSCKQFTFGGCGGNNNNFETEDNCKAFCRPSDVCKQQKYVGRCRAAKPRFYFDAVSGSCKNFIFGGCNANLNNFLTLQACENKCSVYMTTQPNGGVDPRVETTDENICQMGPEKGTCRGYNIKWYYSAARNRCARFIYTGCDGNGNRFDNENACAQRCVTATTRRPLRTTYRPAPEPTTRRPYVVPVDSDPCKSKQDAGPCREWTIKWYYNAEQRRCLRFYYGGCSGNDNRYDDRQECESTCHMRTTPRPRSTQRPRPTTCYETYYGCCKDGRTMAIDMAKSNCDENNVVVRPGGDGDATKVVVKAGTDATLTCSIGNQGVEWYRDGFILSSSSRFTALGNGTLQLKAVTEDMAGRYSCQVARGNRIPDLERFTVAVHEPMQMIPGPALVSVRPSDHAFLHCQATGRPEPRISWQKDDIMLRSNSKLSVFGNGTLIINNVGPRDVGTYECKAANGISSPLKREIEVQIRESIDAIIANHPDYFIDGKDVKLSCRGDGYPTPSVTWVKDGKTLTTEGRVVVQGGQLSIRAASVRDAGVYKCMVDNGRSTDYDFTTVKIKYPDASQCKDKMRTSKCLRIVAARMCGWRYYAQNCCQSCRQKGFS